METKDFNRGKWEVRKRKERTIREQKDIREREYVSGFKGKY